jgi:hypothetical protein
MEVNSQSRGVYGVVDKKEGNEGSHLNTIWVSTCSVWTCLCRVLLIGKRGYSVMRYHKRRAVASILNLAPPLQFLPATERGLLV